MAKARGVDTILGVVVEAWVSAKNQPELFSTSPPYPADITYHINVDQKACYNCDYKVEGFVASGYNSVSFNDGSASQTWKKDILQVATVGQESCPLHVAKINSPARIQARNVTCGYTSSKSVPVILNKIPEWTLDVS